MTMNKRTLFIVMVGLVVMWLLIAATWVVAADGFNLGWYVISGGGNASSSADYVLMGTLGQPVASVSNSTGFRLGGGFWYGIAEIVPAPLTYKVYLPYIFRD
ncbi:MAG: hypothetical protein JXA33_15095 [Anaerolineae bacterium]|nr:hypothetical protein [Anaerolineae bacterium]